jgi:hypothetical protein
VAGRGKYETASIERLEHWSSEHEPSFRDTPLWKSKLKSELKQNPPDLRALLNIYGLADFKKKKNWVGNLCLDLS